MLGEARTAVAARPAMVVAVASTGRVGGAWRALVAPGKSGFVKQGALGAGLARVRPSGRDRWPRRRTAPPWARCRKTEVEETVSGNFVNKPKFQKSVL